MKQIAADAGSGIVHGLRGEVDLALADQTDQAIAEIFALKENKDHEHDHHCGGCQRADIGSDVIFEELNWRWLALFYFDLDGLRGWYAREVSRRPWPPGVKAVSEAIVPPLPDPWWSARWWAWGRSGP